MIKKKKLSISEYFKNVVFPEQDKYFEERKLHPKQNVTIKGCFSKECGYAEA